MEATVDERRDVCAAGPPRRRGGDCAAPGREANMGIVAAPGPTGAAANNSRILRGVGRNGGGCNPRA